MTKYLKACFMAMKKYCFLPIPFSKDDDELKPLMVTCLPFVGLEIGILWAAVYYLNMVLITAGWFPKAIAAVMFTAFPFFASRFIHIEGYCGVNDALHAHKDVEGKRKILKESIVGDFAVVSLIFLFLLYYSAALSLTYSTEEFHILIFLPIVTRCLMAISVSVLPPLETSQFAGDFQKKMSNKRLAFLVIVLILASLLATIMTNFYGLVLVAALLGFFINIMKGYKELDGMNSEIAGYALVKAECYGMIMFALIKPLVNFILGNL